MDKIMVLRKVRLHCNRSSDIIIAHLAYIAAMLGEYP